MTARVEITRLTKCGGPLTKRIYLDGAGKIVSDASACTMAAGTAARVRIADMHELAELIGNLRQHEAITLGTLRCDLPDRVQITTRCKLDALNGTPRPELIARTGCYVTFRQSQPAFALLDYDTKGMPRDVERRINDLGGFWPAVVSIVPELACTACLLRRSTSAGLHRTDTGEKLPGSNGMHVYLLVQDGADVERFLRTCHARCLLAGFGWMMVGGGGQLLERSVIDRMVGAPERLIFEAPPILNPPLAQDHESRKPVARDGDALDTIAACPPLTILEKARLGELRAKEMHRLAPESAKAREAFIREQSKRRGVAPELIAKQCRGILLPAIVLPFDAPELANITVADVLADPARYEGETLADPLEGIEYGRCKAKIMLRDDGALWIHSFAHGRTVYELKQDAKAIRAAIERAPRDEAVAMFVRLALQAELTEDEIEDLRNLTAERTGIGKRAIGRRLKSAREEQQQQQADAERNRRIVERRDPRPQIETPLKDAPWLPVMRTLNDLLGRTRDSEPPARDDDGHVVQVRVRRAASMHELCPRGVNDGDAEDTRLPPPEQPLITRLDEPQVAELIERYIDFYIEEETGRRSVHLPAPFVRHFLIRHDHALPLMNQVATLPIVLPDRTFLCQPGLDRARGIVFRIPPELISVLPQVTDCTPTAVAEAMRFLTDEWLCDVAADYASKGILIALALSVIERALLPERPAFFITAGKRGGGKTTTTNMSSAAILGVRASAAAWSQKEEERRKALLAYFGEGVPLIAWDNIPLGAAISCPSIEKALTSPTYSDRVLGLSETRAVPATAIMVFTGNNIAPRGDLASRSLTARLTTDRPDPENRSFRHPDPLAWTETHRGRILAALYTILLGNPAISPGSNIEAQTRFKTWWRLVGSAVEHGARQHTDHVKALTMDAQPTCQPCQISFRSLFLEAEAGEEQTTSIAIVLDVIRAKWPSGATASDIATYAGAADEGGIVFKAALEAASGKAIKVVTPTVLTWRLKAVIDAPIQVGNAVLVLRYAADHHGGTFTVRTV